MSAVYAVSSAHSEDDRSCSRRCRFDSDSRSRHRRMGEPMASVPTRTTVLDAQRVSREQEASDAQLTDALTRH